MQSIIVQRRNKVSRGTKRILSVVVIAAIAFCISFMENEGEQENVKKFWKDAFHSLNVALSLQTVESYSPAVQYGLYVKAGYGSFAGWEMKLLSESLGKKQRNVIEMIEELHAEQENLHAKEVNAIDQTLIIDRALKENDTTWNDNVGNMGEVGMIYGETYFESAMKEPSSSEGVSANLKLIKKLKSSLSADYLIKNFYIVDSTTSIDKNIFNVEKLLQKDCTMNGTNEKPQILIYHTHGGSESFADSDGTKNESVVGVGTVLAKLLTEEYEYNVIHDEACYDVINGKIDRDEAYDKALKGIKKTLDQYPSIEVMIDVHRDASASKNRVTTIDGEKTAQIMFFNGLSRKSNGEDISYLKNPNLQGNLAFSLKLKMKAMELYPNITTKIYLKGYRYNLHLREKSLLIELGTNLNTVAEAKRAMKPLAEVLNQVLNE